MSTMHWGDERPVTVTEREYAEWKAARHGITLPSLAAIARMKAAEGIAPAHEDDDCESNTQYGTHPGALTSAICLAVLFIGTIITGFAIVSAVIGAVGG